MHISLVLSNDYKMEIILLKFSEFGVSSLNVCEEHKVDEHGFKKFETQTMEVVESFRKLILFIQREFYSVE